MYLLLRSPMISSSTKAIAAIGVLKAAARPAAAPAAAPNRRFCFGSPANPARFEARAPASCTDGPSRPRLLPPPMLTMPATNFTQTTFQGTNPKSFQNAALSCGMPLPAASGQKELSSQPTMSEVERITPRLPSRNVVYDSCESLTRPRWYTRFMPSWNATAARPAPTP